MNLELNESPKRNVSTLEMQLHVCLLLFIIATDKTQASLNHHCGGNVSLELKPTGLISLTLPGLTDSSRAEQCDKTAQPSLCTWLLDLPLGKTVLLKAVWLEAGSNISLHCAWNKEDQALRSRRAALLSHCDRNKAAISWTGAGCSSNAAQLVYRVQEDERNSLEVRSTHHPDQDPTGWSQTATTFTTPATVTQGEFKSPEEDRGLVRSTSSQDEGLLHPTSSQQGHPVAGRADGETILLPEEKPNNGADTSGATHHLDNTVTARTRPYFQYGVGTDPKSKTENPTDLISPKIEMSWTQSAVGRSGALTGTDIHKPPSTQTSQHTEKYVKTQTDLGVSSSTVILLSSSPHDTLAWGSHTIKTVHDSGVSGTPEDKQPLSQRSERSTDFDVTSATTLDPLKLPTESPPHDSSIANTDAEPTPSSSSSSSSSSSFSQNPSRAHSPTTHITELDTAVGTAEAASAHPNASQSDSFVTAQTAVFESSELVDTNMLHTLKPSIESKTDFPRSAERLTEPPLRSSPYNQTNNAETQTATESTKGRGTNSYRTNPVPSSSDITKDDQQTSGFPDSFSTPSVLQTTEVQHSTAADISRETYTSPTTHALLHDDPRTGSATAPAPSSSTTTDATPSYTLQSHTTLPDDTRTSLTFSATPKTSVNHEATPVPSQPTSVAPTRHDLLLPTSTNISPTYKQSHTFITPTFTSEHSSLKSDHREVKAEEGGDFWQWSSTAQPSPTLHPSQQNSWAPTPSPAPSTPSWSSTTNPVFYIVPNQPAAIRVDSVELLLQIIVEESTLTPNLEEDTTAWVEPYLRRVPGFSKLLGVWSSGHAVQTLLEFKTSGALHWLSMTGPSLLERTGLTRAVREGEMFRSSKITNITLGGLQGDVCDWLLQCPAGYKCMLQPGTTNYSCSSVCRSDYCHHHGICTHHPGQLPVCRCLVGDDFWYMGQRCDVRMTRARLAGACLAILLIIVGVVGTLAFVAVRRYRAMLIQAKVDQTRSSYRKFNHFDELSGRFWLRSWPGSADSLDNPAFTRSDELLHLRALDRPCCYHDDTLSLASTCPSHGARLNTIYPHSSQYGWRGSEMSMGDGVLDSGKASDLSVCSWPVEPIHWTPFPLLQQLASHRTPTQVRVSRPRSYCEGMELVDLGKSWTA